MPSIQAFHHIALWTKRYDETLAFYRDGLGLTPIYRFDSGGQRAVILRCGEGPESGHVEVFERNEQDDTPAEARLLHFALCTDDVDGMYRRALDAGAQGRTEPRDVDLVNHLPDTPRPKFAPRIAFVLGPNGEIIEFFDDPNA